MSILNSQFAAFQIVRTLREEGYEAYLAGGCVRDLLLGREPHDYDVATSATPDVVLGIFERTFAVGAHFGVVLVSISSAEDAVCSVSTESAPPQVVVTDTGGAANSACVAESKAAPLEVAQVMVEVATFRSDGAYSDGRRPDAVRYTLSAAEDVQRRDFTINGLLLDPLALEVENSAQFIQVDQKKLRSLVIDHVGGIADLEAGVVRAIGSAELRFEEDHLRMLRGVRFAARLGFVLQEQTAAAMRLLAAKTQAVSRERVRDELTKMLTEGQARKAFELLDETGLLAEVLPEIARMKGVEQPPQFHPEGDVWLHTLGLLGQLEPNCSPTLAWGALLHDVGKPATFRRAERIRFDGHVDVGVAVAAEICRRFRFSNDETRQIIALVENHMRFMDAPRMKSSTQKRFFRLENFPEHLALHRMDCLAAKGGLETWELVRERWLAMPEELVRPQPLITGRDLIAAGYTPGHRFKEMLHAVEDAQLEGDICTRDEAIILVHQRYPIL